MSNPTSVMSSREARDERIAAIADDIRTANRALGFLKGVIQSGERWTEDCQDAYANAGVAMDRIGDYARVAIAREAEHAKPEVEFCGTRYRLDGNDVIRYRPDGRFWEVEMHVEKVRALAGLISARALPQEKKP